MHTTSIIHLGSTLLCGFLALRTVFRASENRQASWLFAAFLLAAASYPLSELWVNEGWYTVVPGAIESSNVLALCIGPLFYLYSRSAAQSGFRLRWRHLACFTLPLLFVPVALLAFAVPKEVHIAAIREEQESFARGQPALDTLVTLAVFDVYHLAFLGAACWKLWRGRETLHARAEEGAVHPVRALEVFAAGVLAVAVASAVLEFSPWAVHGSSVVGMAILLLMFAVLWISAERNPFAAPARRLAPPLTQPTETLQIVPPAPETAQAFGTTTRVVADENTAAPLPAAFEAAPAEDLPAPSRSGRRDQLKPEDLDRLARKVSHLLENEAVFLEPDLSLQKLADRLGTTRHKLSVVINERLGGTFFQVVAAYRVRKAADELRDPANSAKTIAEIALGCGFNSLSSFNAAFRAQFGKTPREYRESAPDSAATGEPLTAKSTDKSTADR